MRNPLPTGKLPAELLAGFLARLSHTDERVIVGPGIGRDAAVIDIGERYLVCKTDPVTFATENIGWYTVHVNANDIACLGAHPKWFMASVLLPAGLADEAMAEAIFNQLVEACAALKVTLVGGHTEITYDLPRPIVTGVMLGEVEKDKLVTIDGARPGDAVCLTKAFPLEGTALIASEKADELRGRGFTDDFIAQARGLLRTPGISIVPEALVAADSGLATAMHDPTEGGLATGLWELAQAAHAGLEIDEQALPRLPDGIALCNLYGLDPLGVIASGSLLITTPNAPDLVDLLQGAGIACTVIGRVVPPEDGVTLVDGAARRCCFAADEVTRLFG